MEITGNILKHHSCVGAVLHVDFKYNMCMKFQTCLLLKKMCLRNGLMFSLKARLKSSLHRQIWEEIILSSSDMNFYH